MFTCAVDNFYTQHVKCTLIYLPGLQVHTYHIQHLWEACAIQTTWQNKICWLIQMQQKHKLKEWVGKKREKEKKKRLMQKYLWFAFLIHFQVLNCWPGFHRFKMLRLFFSLFARLLYSSHCFLCVCLCNILFLLFPSHFALKMFPTRHAIFIICALSCIYFSFSILYLSLCIYTFRFEMSNFVVFFTFCLF